MEREVSPQVVGFWKKGVSGLLEATGPSHRRHRAVVDQTGHRTDKHGGGIVGAGIAVGTGKGVGGHRGSPGQSSPKLNRRSLWIGEAGTPQMIGFRGREGVEVVDIGDGRRRRRSRSWCGR